MQEMSPLIHRSLLRRQARRPVTEQSNSNPVRDHEMWTHVLRNLARSLSPPRLPESDLATQSARYCYSVWLRHLVNAWQQGLHTLPEVVVELGPGSSQGV